MTAENTFTAYSGPSGNAAPESSGKSVQSAMLPESVLRIPVAIQVVIGSTRLPLSQVTQLGPGSLITLDQKVGEQAVILVNGKEVAQGELVVLDGEAGHLGITISEVAGSRGPVSA